MAEHAPQHLFGDLQDAVTEEALETMKGIVSDSADTEHNEESQKIFMRKLIWPLIQGCGDGLRKTAPCILHGGHEGCPVAMPVSGESGSKFRLRIAGSPCVDWSRRGKRSKAFGATAIPYCIWLAQLIAAQVYIFVHECTPDFPDWMLLDLLERYSSRAWRPCVIRMCPSNLGVPVRRKRRYTIAWRCDKVTFNGSFGDFVNLFFRQCQLRGDVFFREGPSLEPTDSKTKHESHAMYSEIRNKKMQDNPLDAAQNMADLQQRPPYGSLDNLVPCLTTGSCIYNLPRGRFLTAMEVLDVMGVPRDSPLGDMLRSGLVSEASLRKLLKNTMAISCMGTVLLYVVCHAKCARDV